MNLWWVVGDRKKGERITEGHETFEDDGYSHYLECGDSFKGI
jgi:hypothetical protein